MLVDGNSKESDELSYKIFGKSGNEIKYIMLTNYVHERLVNEESLLRTGLYSWIPVFNGEIQYFKKFNLDDCSKYDIIHVNLSGQDAHLLGCIREKLGNNSKTKLVASNDYTVELWQGSFDYPPMMRREFNHADVLFGTEPNQVGSLEVLLKRKVHLITHPCFVKRLKTLKPGKILNVISVVSHRYDSYNVIPSLAVEGLGPKTRLIGYENESDRKKYVTSTCYNEILGGTNYFEFTKQLQESKVVVDLFTLTSQSRTGWDCASMGVPLIGSDRCYSHQVCYPKTCVPPFNMKIAREKIKRILTDEQFRNEVIEYAQNAVEYVSYDNSRRKFLEALYEGSPNIDI